MAISLPNFPAFEVHLDGNTRPRWKKWLTRLERLLTGMNITGEKTKKSTHAALCWSRSRLQNYRIKADGIFCSTDKYNIRGL